jgi:TP901 family phage tail tape measure protein
MLRDLFVRIRVDNKEVDEKIKKTSHEVDKAKQEFDKLGTAMSAVAAIGLGALVGTALSRVVGVGASFEAEMSQVRAATNSSLIDLQTLSTEARRLGASSTFSATEAAQAMTELGKAGFTTQQLLTGTSGVLDLAAAGSLGLAEASSIAADTMSGFGLVAEDMGRIADVLAKGANSSTISVAMMGETFKYVAGVAKTANVSLEETAAMTAILGNAGIKGSMAGTTLKAMLLRLASPSGEAAKALAQLGVKADDGAGKMRNIADIMGDLQKATRNMGNQKKLDYLSTIFGAEPAAGMVALLEKGKEGIEDMTKIMRESGGSAKAFAEIANDNVMGKWKAFNSILEELQLKFYDLIGPILKSILGFFADSERGMSRTTIAIGFLAVALGTTLVLAAKSAMLAGYAMLVPYLPMIALVAAISAGVMGLYLVLEDIYTFMEYGPEGSETFFGDFLKMIGFTNEDMQKLRDVFNEFKLVLSQAGQKMGEFFESEAGQKIIAIAKTIAKVTIAISLLPAIVGAAIITLPLLIIAKWDDMMNWMRNQWNRFTTWFRKTAILAGKAVLMFMFPLSALYIFRKEIISTLDNIWQKIQSMPFVTNIVNQFLTLKDRISGVFSGMWQSLTATFRNLLPTDTINTIIDSMNWISRKLNEFSSGAVASRLGITPLNLPVIPRIEARALGGPITAGMPYLVGERGPELVVPRNNGTVIPNDRLQAGSGNSPIIFNANFNLSGGNAKEQAVDIWETLKQLAKDNQNEIRVQLGLRPV